VGNSLLPTVKQEQSNARGLAGIPRDSNGDVAHVCVGSGPNLTTAGAPNQPGIQPQMHKPRSLVLGRECSANQAQTSPNTLLNPPEWACRSSLVGKNKLLKPKEVIPALTRHLIANPWPASIASIKIARMQQLFCTAPANQAWL